MTFNEQLAKYLTETWSYQKNQKVYVVIKSFSKNLFNPAAIIFNNATRTGDTYELTSTAAVKNHYLPVDLLPLKPNTIYTITLVASNNTLDSDLYIQLSAGGNRSAFSAVVGSTPITITGGSNGEFTAFYKTIADIKGTNFNLIIDAGTSGKSVNLKVMVAEGEVDGTFTDYGDAPTPTNPSTLKTVKSPLQIITANNNIAEHKGFFDEVNKGAIFSSGTWTGVFFPEAESINHRETNLIDGRNCARVQMWGFIGYTLWTGNVFKPNTQYSIKWDYKNEDAPLPLRTVGIQFYYTDGSTLSITGSSSTFVSRTYTSEAGKTVAGIAITYGSGNGGFYIDLDSIQFFEGTVAPPYEPHRGSITQIELKAIDNSLIELYSDAAGTQDEVDVDRGVVIKRVQKSINLKGTVFNQVSGANWQKPNAFSAYILNKLPLEYRSAKMGLTPNTLSAHFKTGTWNMVNTVVPYNYIMTSGRNVFVSIENSITGIDPSDSDAVKLSKVSAIFSGIDIYLYYKLETPYEIPLHEDTILQLRGALLRRPDDDDEYNLWVENTPEPEITYDTFKWQEPVYDRTLHNAKNARMGIQADFAKGIFSDTVWNRIKGNQIVIKYLISWFYEYIPVELLDLAVKKQDLVGFASWADIESWITDLDLNEMATNDRTLMKQLPTAHANYVPPKNDYVGGLGNGSTSPDWNDLNILERTLQLIKETILSTIANYRICGEPITSANPQQIDII